MKTPQSKSLLEYIKKICSDPVWSKVIANGITYLFTLIIGLTLLAVAFLFKHKLLGIELLLFISWICCLYLYFRKKIIGQSFVGVEPVKSPALSKKKRQFLRIVIFVLPLIALSVWLIEPRNSSSSKFTVLVARFVTEDSEHSGLTDDIFMQLRNATKKYPEIEIIALGAPITEEQGNLYARKVGEEKQASMVLWGRYPKKQRKSGLLYILNY
jgi:hypothetical protein